ncbi:hypothetical protein [Streptomyces sp. BH105]|uniref:hypothetical protein n=1 Tax=Streptomyces sp. BH105 TaxID=3410408 RepID=UPI003CED70BE
MCREELIEAVLESRLGHKREGGRLRDNTEPTGFLLIQLTLRALSRRTGDVAPDLWQRHLALLLGDLRPSSDAPSPLPQRTLNDDEFERSMM